MFQVRLRLHPLLKWGIVELGSDAELPVHLFLGYTIVDNVEEAFGYHYIEESLGELFLARCGTGFGEVDSGDYGSARLRTRLS